MDAIAARLGIDRDRGAPPQSHSATTRCRTARPLATLGTEVVLEFRRLCRRCSTRRWRRSDGTSCSANSQRRRAGGEVVGAGLALFVEKSGLGPFDGVRCRVDTAGAVEVVTGARLGRPGVRDGDGADLRRALGVDYRRVRVMHGRTDRIAYGIGAHASRATVMTGEATRIAAVKCAPRRSRSRPSCCRRRRCARHRRWQGGAQASAGGPSIALGEIAKALAADIEAARRRASPASRPRAGSTAIT